MLKIGCHLSSSKGYLAMGIEAVSIGANIFQFFTRNPRGGAAKPFDEADAANYLKFAHKHGLGPILAHAPYTLNACAAGKSLRTFTQETIADDLSRLAHFPGNLYNFHPGSHVNQGAEQGIQYISETLNQVLEPQQSTVVLLETMAGKGSEVGGTFEELRAIIDLVEQKDRLGVCLDTCHVFDGGYDIVNNLDGVLETFDRIIGLDRLRAIHINDSKNPLGSHKDRHEKIGQGNIGIDAFERIINHPSLRNLPFYLETPNDVPGYAREIALLKKLYRKDHKKEKKL
jgi:deoxyribonuclease-4